MGQVVQSKAGAAKARFLEADARYDNSKTLAEVLSYLDRYLDPSEDRAPGLRRFVRRLKGSINEFTDETSALMLAILEVQVALTGQALRLTSGAFQSPENGLAGAPSEVLESFRRWRRKIQDAQRAFEKLDPDERLAQVYEIGALVVELRTKVIDEFARSSLGLTIEDYEKAAVATLREELLNKVTGAFDGLVTILETEDLWIELVGEGVAAVVPFGTLYKLGKAAKALHDKAKEVAEPYIPRGPVDELFNFVDAINDTNILARQQIAVL